MEVPAVRAAPAAKPHGAHSLQICFGVSKTYITGKGEMFLQIGPGIKATLRLVITTALLVTSKVLGANAMKAVHVHKQFIQL